MSSAMASGDLSQKFQNLKIKKLEDVKDISILVLGSLGVGKTTLINSIVSYLHYGTFEEALRQVRALDRKIGTINSSTYKFQERRPASTTDIRTYVFPIDGGKTRLNFIDTPGLLCPTVPEDDVINPEIISSILAHLTQLEELHAICILIDPQSQHKSFSLKLCMEFIVPKLHKSATKNIIFIFTKTKPSEIDNNPIRFLEKLLEESKLEPRYLPFDYGANIFLLDNISFRFFLAMKNGISFDDSVERRYRISWQNATRVVSRIISFIRQNLRPCHLNYHPLSVNYVRGKIVQLYQALGDIIIFLNDSVRILSKHQKDVEMNSSNSEHLKPLLYIPILDLVVTELPEPVTVCMNPTCAESEKHGDVKRWNYRKCHVPCYLSNSRIKICNDLNLKECSMMTRNLRTSRHDKYFCFTSPMCKKCTCEWFRHMRVYYMTDSRIIEMDCEGDRFLHSEAHAMRRSRRLIDTIDRRKRELNSELTSILKSAAKFARFLNYHSPSEFIDPYRNYLTRLQQREESCGDEEDCRSLEQVINRYDEIKATVEAGPSVTVEVAHETIRSLYEMKHTRAKMRELTEKQKTSRTAEYIQSCEVIYPNFAYISQDDRDISRNWPTPSRRRRTRSDDYDQISLRSRYWPDQSPPPRRRSVDGHDHRQRNRRDRHDQNIPRLHLRLEPSLGQRRRSDDGHDQNIPELHHRSDPSLRERNHSDGHDQKIPPHGLEPPLRQGESSEGHHKNIPGSHLGHDPSLRERNPSDGHDYNISEIPHGVDSSLGQGNRSEGHEQNIFGSHLWPGPSPRRRRHSDGEDRNIPRLRNELDPPLRQRRHSDGDCQKISGLDPHLRQGDRLEGYDQNIRPDPLSPRRRRNKREQNIGRYHIGVDLLYPGRRRSDVDDHNSLRLYERFAPHLRYRSRSESGDRETARKRFWQNLSILCRGVRPTLNSFTSHGSVLSIDSGANGTSPRLLVQRFDPDMNQDRFSRRYDSWTQCLESECEHNNEVATVNLEYNIIGFPPQEPNRPFYNNLSYGFRPPAPPPYFGPHHLSPLQLNSQIYFPRPQIPYPIAYQQLHKIDYQGYPKIPYQENLQIDCQNPPPFSLKAPRHHRHRENLQIDYPSPPPYFFQRLTQEPHRENIHYYRNFPGLLQVSDQENSQVDYSNPPPLFIQGSHQNPYFQVTNQGFDQVASQESPRVDYQNSRLFFLSSENSNDKDDDYREELAYEGRFLRDADQQVLEVPHQPPVEEDENIPNIPNVNFLNVPFFDRNIPRRGDRNRVGEPRDEEQLNEIRAVPVPRRDSGIFDEFR